MFATPDTECRLHYHCGDSKRNQNKSARNVWTLDFLLSFVINGVRTFPNVWYVVKRTVLPVRES